MKDVQARDVGLVVIWEKQYGNQQPQNECKRPAFIKLSSEDKMSR